MKYKGLTRNVFICAILAGLLLTSSCGGGGGDNKQDSQSPWIGLWNAVEIYDPDAGRWMSVAEYFKEADDPVGFDYTITMNVTEDRMTTTVGITGSISLVVDVTCVYTTTYTVDSNNRLFVTVESSDCGSPTVGEISSSTLEFENSNNTMILRDDDGSALKLDRQ